jgi:hypothetical protein
MESLMDEGTHYDDVTGDGRNSLMQPGAEKLCFAFKFSPSFDVERIDYAPDDVPNADEPVEGHREYIVNCKLHHRPTGKYVGSGRGSCSTIESKYRYRKDEEITDVKPPQAFWDSYDKEQGENMGDADFSILRDHLNAQRDTPVPADADVGVEFVDDSPLITYEKGRKENPDIADQYNTVLKMAEKRALVNAVKRNTAASDIFTQDTEDLAVRSGSNVQRKQPRQSSGKANRAGQNQQRRPSRSGQSTSKQSGTDEKTSGSEAPQKVERYGHALLPSQAEKLGKRDDALAERDGDDLAAAIASVESEMEGWPSDHLCSACDTMLDSHRERLQKQTEDDDGDTTKDDADAAKEAADNMDPEEDEPEEFEDADGELPF